MKLIVDIPEDIITAIQNGEDYRYDIHTAIAQGIPYEERPQGDLISRKVLIREIGRTDEWYKGRTVCNIIDNAPTVEPFEPDYVGAERLKARQRGYEEGYHYGMKIGKNLNPKIKQGEWIDKMATEGYVVCPFCGKEITGGDLNFCVKCGADMRGKSNDT